MVKIYVEDNANDKVAVLDYGELETPPANSEEIDVPDGKFDDTFRMYKRIQILNEDDKYDGIFTADNVPFDTDSDEYTQYNGRSLVYYKSTEVVTWDDVVMKPKFTLTTDATDTYTPYNGIADIEADGTSYCTITIQKKDYLDNDMTAAEDNDTVTIETSRGKLSAIQVDLVNGTKTFTLTSVPETCIASVRVFSDGIKDGNIKIQFAPGT